MTLRLSGRIFCAVAVVLLFLPACPGVSQEAEEAAPASAPRKSIEEYRQILKTESDPRAVARAHLEIGLILEGQGKETGATAEYLKIIVNYPQIDDVNQKAQARLAHLYSGFSEKSKQPVSQFEPTEEQKDPTIFFAYIKSLYENYRNLGQYEKAMYVLQRLYDLDPDNQSYLSDMGEIYLEGYNSVEKAIFHFKKAVELNPDNLKAYVNLGKAYEKKEDFENAVRVYTQTAATSPASPWAMYGLRRIEAIRLARDKRLVKDWYFLGPFDNSDRKGLEKYFPPEEAIDLKAAYRGKDDTEIRWTRPFDYTSSGYADLNVLIRPNDYAIAYALTYVHSPDEREVALRLGSEDGIKVWINDELVFTYDISRSAEADDDIVPVRLMKGWNKVLVKVSDTWGAWGFYFRITDLKGNPFEDLIFDPLRDGERVKRIYGKLKRAKRFQITKIAASYTVAFSILILGLYFMVSNIVNRVKINRMKEDFISSVSHELKTPIAAVKMLAETLKMGKVKQTSRQDQYYDMIIRESDRLTRFINKILDFSKIEKGGKVFYFEKANVVDLAKSAVDIFRDETRDENLKLNFNTEKDEITAEVDKDAILQVVFNLIDNAYKYSKKEGKEITVNVKTTKRDARIEVADKGLGMPKSQIEKVFDKFYRIERDIMKGTKGSGLGLAFVKSVIDSHGGKVAVESELGKGSTFIISLPLGEE